MVLTTVKIVNELKSIERNSNVCLIPDVHIFNPRILYDFRQWNESNETMKETEEISASRSVDSMLGAIRQ